MLFGRRRKRRRERELDPDEIFLDSSNLSDFDTGQLEGRLEKPIERNTFAGIGVVALIIGTALVAQAANLQMIQGERYSAQSERNRLRPQVLFAERGAIVDRNGFALVYNEAGDDGFVTRKY
ncbi:hypothetical protein KKG57_00580, partial [Patescibacteria group bacterium]|nr:hypothetical protein [Patescibacteria group bacterium]